MDRDMKHIGILMHSAEGALLCFRTAIHEAIERLGEHCHPQVTMSGRAMALALEAWDAGDLEFLRDFFAKDGEALAAAGADFFVLPDNTAHIALEAPGDPLPLPCLHIGEVVGDEAASRDFAKLGILGTRWTMEGPVYRGACERRGMEWAVPDADARQAVHAIIMDELCLGDFREESIKRLVGVIEALAAEDCDAVALVCTELPIVLGDTNSPLPALDSTRLLAGAAVDVALGERPLPEWRGGPLPDHG